MDLIEEDVRGDGHDKSGKVVDGGCGRGHGFVMIGESGQRRRRGSMDASDLGRGLTVCTTSSESDAHGGCDYL